MFFSPCFSCFKEQFWKWVFIKIYLFENKSHREKQRYGEGERERERTQEQEQERDLPFAGTLPGWLQWLALRQVKAGTSSGSPTCVARP